MLESTDPLYNLSEKVDGAMREAAITVVQRAKSTNTPIVIWEDGQVKEVSYKRYEHLLPKEPEADAGH